jgi:hypothetical protein
MRSAPQPEPAVAISTAAPQPEPATAQAAAEHIPRHRRGNQVREKIEKK